MNIIALHINCLSSVLIKNLTGYFYCKHDDVCLATDNKNQFMNIRPSEGFFVVSLPAGVELCADFLWLNKDRICAEAFSLVSH